MELDKYAAASNDHATELLQSLTPEDVKLLASELKKFGLVGWNQWQLEFGPQISDYVAASPSQRKRHIRSSDLLRLLYSFAAWRQARGARILLWNLAAYASSLCQSQPLRDTTAQIGTVFWEVKDSQVPDWPFDDVCPSPFADS